MTGQPTDRTPPVPVDAFLHEPPLAAAQPTTLAAISEADAGDRPVDLRAWLTGTGTPAPLPGRAGPSNLVRCGDEVVVIDLGNGVGYQLMRLGIHPRDVDFAVITHHHFDHNVDLAYFLLAPWAQKVPSSPPTILGPPGTVEYVNRILAAHDYDIRARRPHGFDHRELQPAVVELVDGDRLVRPGWSLTAIRVDHDPVAWAFGYRIDAGARAITFSGDTRPNANLVRRAAGSTALVHEAIFPGFGIPEYHTLANDVGKVAAEAGVERLLLTHLLPGDRADHEWVELAGPGFDGPITVGQDLLEVPL